MTETEKFRTERSFSSPPTGPAFASAVGMYQMTDAPFAQARQHTVVEDGCWSNWLRTCVLPSQAIELTAVFLDRNVTAVLARWPKVTANQQQKQALAIAHWSGTWSRVNSPSAAP
jgi:hypothetical protein